MSQVAYLAEIGLLLYPHAQLAAIHGLTDLFTVADRLARERLGGSGPLLRISHFSCVPDAAAPARVFDTHPQAEGQPAVLIVPPSLADPLTAEAMPSLAAWLRERHAAGAALAAVCSGAFVLAQTGLLAGRTATTHWIYAEALSLRHPGIRVDTGPLVIDHGDILTAGGLMAWTDLGLTLVDRLLGPDAMQETARFLLVDPPASAPRQPGFSPELAHGDAAILKVQQWLQREGTRHVTIAAMAAQANLEPRTFLRRFHKATGYKPTEYCQHQRVDDAREMLVATSLAVDQIAWHVGYGDPASFRKVFTRSTGLSPRDYRRRFRPQKAA
jgi:transcriptional regulator GlxA family with amidase domain